MIREFCTFNSKQQAAGCRRQAAVLHAHLHPPPSGPAPSPSPNPAPGAKTAGGDRPITHPVSPRPTVTFRLVLAPRGHTPDSYPGQPAQRAGNVSTRRAPASEIDFQCENLSFPRCFLLCARSHAQRCPAQPGLAQPGPAQPGPARPGPGA